MVKDATIFTKFDIRSGYNNIRIKEGDQWKAAFIMSKGLFKLTVMFFRLSNSPTTFQRFMNDSFKDMIAEGWLIVYMDDMLITATNEQENIEQTKRVLQRMKELDLHLKLKKCKFGVKEVDFLGFILLPGEIAMDPTKLSRIAEWPTPTKVKDVQSFLGFTNYYRRFIGDYSNIARLLIDLTKKNQEWRWTPSCQKAFDSLKEDSQSNPSYHFLTSINHLPSPQTPPKMHLEEFFFKQTQMENGTPVLISPNLSPPLKETMTSMTGNSLQLYEA